MRDVLKSLQNQKSAQYQVLKKFDIVRFIMKLNYEEKVQIHELKNKESA